MSQTARSTGSVKSYVIGFIVSLLCTAIPYYLVVTKTVSGNTLLATIIGFALLQMLIQIFFFLHLGRGPKPLYNVAFFAATVGIILVVVGGSIFIIDHLHYNMTPTEASKQLAEGEAIHEVGGKKTGACQGVKANHKITIAGSTVSPLKTEAYLCDTLSFINEDNAVHKIGFGTSTKPGTYAGLAELTVRKGLSKTITLNQAGTYQFYDQLYPGLKYTFTVTPQ